MKTSLNPSHTRRNSHAFTLIELLTVIAVIGILASILIPVVGNARSSAMAAKSRYEFTQIANACIKFKADYGYWPSSNNSVSTEGGDLFDVLMADMDSSTAKRLNRRMAPYYSPGNVTEKEGYVIDGFGNSDIHVIFYSGREKIPTISASTVNGVTVKTGNPEDNKSNERENVSPHIDDDVRAQVVVFSAGDGKKAVGTWSD